MVRLFSCHDIVVRPQEYLAEGLGLLVAEFIDSDRPLHDPCGDLVPCEREEGIPVAKVLVHNATS